MMTKDQREAIRVRLAELEMDGGGRLTPSAVVVDAKDPDSPLHQCFTWDVEKAAEAYWLDQARALITSVHVVTRTETRQIRSVFYIRDPSAGEMQGYVSVETLRSDQAMAREAIVNEFSRIADLLRRARDLAVALGAENDVQELLQSVVGMRSRFMDHPTAQQ